MFSSTKAVTSVVIAMLVDRGLLSYDTKIADVWPEFSEHGKDVLTIEDLMKHESGLDAFDFTITSHDLQRQHLKDKSSNKVHHRIASSKSKRVSHTNKNQHKHGDISKRNDDHVSYRYYHFITRGFILNEIVMRVDTNHRTIGEFIRDEIAIPLQIPSGFTLGNETIQYENLITPLTGNSNMWLISQFVLLFTWSEKKHSIKYILYWLFALNVSYLCDFAVYLSIRVRRIECTLFIYIYFLPPKASNESNLLYKQVKYYYALRKRLLGSYYPKGQPSIAIMRSNSDDSRRDVLNFDIVQCFNHPTMRRAEAPSCNGHASARGMAKIASIMANHGSEYSRDGYRAGSESSEFASTIEGKGGSKKSCFQLLSKETSALCHGNVTEKFDNAIYQTTKFNRGGWNVFDGKFAHGKNRHGSVGWFGIGGSCLQWQHANRVGFGYTCNLLGIELGSKNSSILQNEILKCAKKLANT